MSKKKTMPKKKKKKEKKPIQCCWCGSTKEPSMHLWECQDYPRCPDCQGC